MINTIIITKGLSINDVRIENELWLLFFNREGRIDQLRGVSPHTIIFLHKPTEYMLDIAECCDANIMLCYNDEGW